MDWLEVGKVVKTVGLRGDLKIYPYAEEHSLREGIGLRIDETRYVIAKLYYAKRMPVVHLQGVESIEAAERLLEKKVFLQRSDVELEEDEYLVIDLIGLRVRSDEGEQLGILEEILSPSNQDVYVVRNSSGEELLIPAVGEFIKDISLERGEIIVKLWEGMR